MDREGEEQGAVENDCQGGQGSPRAVAPRGGGGGERLYNGSSKTKGSFQKMS